MGAVTLCLRELLRLVAGAGAAAGFIAGAGAAAGFIAGAGAAAGFIAFSDMRGRIQLVGTV
ncbi:hypothetical protein CYJ40_04955 [Brevibacterium ravenspurgense]|uniref:Uncharacterized protein n=1 Tax=Brevibacterium ravenspurgense TaxID=479117 RepID=A0A2I1IH84_9MICO|nr:hypothetical protein CYJ40_04955 [Brevibacterium ravenspurgense]